MTTDDQQQETNQDVFDEYVRRVLVGPPHVLGNTGVAYIEGPIERVLAEIENGEAGTEAALNLMAIAHVKFMFDRVFTPFPDEPGWTERMEALHPRIEEAIGLCPILLTDFEPEWRKNLREWEQEQTAKNPTETERFQETQKPYKPLDAIEWVCLAAEGYSPSPDWLESMRSTGISSGEPVLMTSLFRPNALFLLYDFLLSEVTLSGADIENNRYQQALATFSEQWSEVEDWESLSTWHRHFLMQLIAGTLASPSELPWDEWVRALDLCAGLMEINGFLDRFYFETGDAEPRDFDTSPELPIDSKEHWAWEFGRIAALWPIVDKAPLEEDWLEAVWDWPNGLFALSLIAPQVDAAKGNSEYLWLGILSSWGNHERDDFGRTWPDEYGNRLTDLSLHWLSQLGYLDGTKKIGNLQETERSTVSGLVPVEPSNPPGMAHEEANALLVGRYKALGEANIRATEMAEQQRIIDAAISVQEILGETWERLPEDARDPLIRAEIKFQRRHIVEPTELSQDLQKAVEIVLEDWLRAPSSRGDWPGDSIPEWARVMIAMTGPKNKRGRLDGILRKQFDATYAKELGEALDVVRRFTVRDRHSRQPPPRPYVVREYVLGTDTRKNIFELILRFAKRMRD